MRKMKRVLAATLAMTVLFATSVMAQTPREILSHAYASSAEATTLSMSGNIAGVVNLMGMELLTLNMDIIMDVDMDMDTGSMMMYMRIPMQISGTDPITGESMDENVEVAMFMDGTNIFVYEATIGWFTDPSMDMAAEMSDVFAMMEGMDELMAWSMELNEQIMDQITIEFAADQVEGFYVIEQFMNWDDIVNMMDTIFTEDFFESIFAFMSPEDLAMLEADLAELDGMMDELMEELGDLFDAIDFDLEMVFRSYIDVETLEFDIYTMVMNLDFAADLDLGIMGNLDISGSFVIDFEFDYNPNIVWPVIGDVATLDDIIAELDIDVDAILEDDFFEDVAVDVDVMELVFGENMLENRVAWMINGQTISATLNLVVEYEAGLNVFIVNQGTDAISISVVGLHDTSIAPGDFFVMQAPAGSLDGGAVIIIDGGGTPIDVETGFRLTHYPLSR